jgi:hypothetical protein
LHFDTRVLVMAAGSLIGGFSTTASEKVKKADSEET